MKVSDIFEYDDYTPGEDFNPANDPNVQSAFQEQHVSLYDVIEMLGERISDEDVEQLEIFATQKGRDMTTEDVYVPSDEKELLAQAILRDDRDWISSHIMTFDEWADSTEGREVMNDIGANQAEERSYNRDPYSYHGVNKRDFM